MTSKVLCGINQLRHLISHQRKVCKSLHPHGIKSVCVCVSVYVHVCVCARAVRLISWSLTPGAALTGSATLWSIDSPNPTSVFKTSIACHHPDTAHVPHPPPRPPTCGPRTGTRVVFRATPPSSSLLAPERPTLALAPLLPTLCKRLPGSAEVMHASFD